MGHAATFAVNAAFMAAQRVNLSLATSEYEAGTGGKYRSSGRRSDPTRNLASFVGACSTNFVLFT